MQSRALAIVLLTLSSVASGAELETAEEIDACYQANFPKQTSKQTISMNARDRIGSVTTSQATMYWKRFDDGMSKVMMRFFAPADMRSAGILMIEKKKRNDMFMYLPELGRVKRVTSRMTSSSMFGTDFSYEDFERMQGMAKTSKLTREQDASVNDRPTYVLSTVPGPDAESEYERIRMFIDKETCLSARAEFYERGDTPRKILTAVPDKIVKKGDIWMALEMRMQDNRDETATTMVIEEAAVDVDIPRKIFTERELLSGGA